MAIRFSILDLAPIVEGGTAAAALQNSLDLARHAERCGYHRNWLAEHHNMPGITSAAPSVRRSSAKYIFSTLIGGVTSIALPAYAQSEESGHQDVAVQAFGSFVTTTTQNRIDKQLVSSRG